MSAYYDNREHPEWVRDADPIAADWNAVGEDFASVFGAHTRREIPPEPLAAPIPPKRYRWFDLHPLSRFRA
jgi:hypothetical protein